MGSCASKAQAAGIGVTRAVALERVRRIELPYSAWEARQRWFAGLGDRAKVLVRMDLACPPVFPITPP